ncbi:FAD-binding oxidoreductase [Muricauda sp. 2012CJ35-5]|uniref:FAD-binding oxidoreductase n=1 Tax=Flagellimonas spongiicola TaxID=2942208 RepID=A0ABT0PS17_9FLAO|nr:FAD-dependent oxidoreductase [Allomuricauda spongiicola]MCL6274185.1 FAD-binding oxidoreductase [Allomuricauda spongiicola]
MNLSYWEYKTWFSNVDFTIVGSGIVGLNCALELREKHPKSKILVLEKGALPQGASTKNAGFACFGSISEVISDLSTHSEQEVFELVQKRFQGIQLLRQRLGDKNIGFKQLGGHELFFENRNLFANCKVQLKEVNALLEPVFAEKPFELTPNVFGFDKVNQNYITHKFEGQLDTGKMMNTLVQKCQKNGIHILNGITVSNLEDNGNLVTVQSPNLEFKSNKVCVATNGFASTLLSSEEVQPARAQVLITEPIANLKIKGTFHLDEGYYYFRNIDNRILFGGGRNLDFETEETMDFGQTKIVQDQLEKLLKQVILPHQKVQIAQRWSGIMGVGLQKSPIVKQVSNNISCGVRLGGMGVALGSLVGKELAEFHS